MGVRGDRLGGFPVRGGEFFAPGRKRVAVAFWAGDDYAVDVDDLFDVVQGVERSLGAWSLATPGDDLAAVWSLMSSAEGGLGRLLRAEAEVWAPALAPHPHEAEAWGPLGACVPRYWPLALHPRARRWVNDGPTKATAASIVDALNRVSPRGVRSLGEVVIHPSDLARLWVAQG